MSQTQCQATFQDNCKVFKGDEKIFKYTENCLDNVFIIAKYNVIKTIKRKERGITHKKRKSIPSKTLV